MKTHSILTIGLLTVLWLAGCSPATVSVPTPSALPVTESPTESPPLPTETPAVAAATRPPTTQTSTEVPQVVATSRGPRLEATDPSTYVRASGGLQLVEFFAFW
jgi:hypothetical protein